MIKKELSTKKQTKDEAEQILMTSAVIKQADEVNNGAIIQIYLDQEEMEFDN